MERSARASLDRRTAGATRIARPPSTAHTLVARQPQALRLVGKILHAPFPLGARLEQVAYLLMPVWQGIIGPSFLTAIALMILQIAPFWNGGPSWQLLLFYALAFGGTILGYIASRRSVGVRGWLVGFLIGNVYALYTWLLCPVLLRSTVRQLTNRQNWSKTEREPIETEAGNATELRDRRLPST
jgi:hypothetical protein